MDNVNPPVMRDKPEMQDIFIITDGSGNVHGVFTDREKLLEHYPSLVDWYPEHGSTLFRHPSKSSHNLEDELEVHHIPEESYNEPRFD